MHVSRRMGVDAHLAGGAAVAIITAALAIGGLSVMALSTTSRTPSSAVVPAAADGIPDEVRQVAASVVIVRQADGSASGVVLDDSALVTAGHAAVSRGRVACDKLSVATNAGYRGVTSASVRYGGGTDMALLFSAELAGQPKAAVSAVKARPGETVYFANWQNRVDGAARTVPALFAGTVISQRDGSYSLAVRNDAGYGLASDRLLRQGGSGGAVFDANGRLLAVSVSVDALSASHSSGDLRRQYGVRLSAGWYQVTRAQMISEPLIDSMRGSTVACR